MGSPRALVLLATVAACNTSGLEIVVRAPDEGIAPDRIRLFVGQQLEENDLVRRIAPQGFGYDEERRGNLWVRDAFNERDLFEDVAAGETVSFGFLAQADHQELGAIVAVGYTGDEITSAGSLFHVTTGLDVVLRYQLQLHPVAPELEVVVWGPMPGDETCVHVANTREDRVKEHLHDNIFLVASADDRDCDGFPDDDPRECTPAVYQGTAPPRPQDLTCAKRVTEAQASWCVLAGATCTDDVAQDRAECVASRYCAPDSVCSACMNMPYGMRREDCVRDPFAHAGTNEMYGIKCHVPARGEQSSTAPVQLCDTPLPLPLELPPTMTPTSCSDARILRPGLPVGSRLQIDDTELEVNVTSGCTFELKAKGERARDASPISGLVTMELDTERSIALPIRIIVDPPAPACTPGLGCVFVYNTPGVDRPESCLVGL